MLLGLCGCAAARAFRVGQVCKPEAAQQAGIADARRGRELDEDYARICGVAESSLNKLYRDAYDSVPAGSREKPGFFRRLFRLG